jgi:transposase InsO family protein
VCVACRILDPPQLLQVSRAAYYADRRIGPSRRELEDDELTEAIRSVHEDSKGRYGAPRIHAELRRAGRRHGRKRIARLMCQARLRGRTPKLWKKKTTIADPAAAARADLVRRDLTTP